MTHVSALPVLLEDGTFYPARRGSAAAESCPFYMRHQWRCGAGCQRRDVSQGSVLPAANPPSPSSTAARPHRRPAPPGPSLRGQGGARARQDGADGAAGALKSLNTYHFPGNVRELEALVFDAVARHQGTTLSLQSFAEVITGKPQPAGRPSRQKESPTALKAWFPAQLPTLKEVEEALLSEALSRADGHQGVAAALLGISRQALNKRLHRR